MTMRPLLFAVALSVLMLGLAIKLAGGDEHRPVPPRQHVTIPRFLTRPITSTTPNAEQLQRGQYLVRAGDCASCHTANGGAIFAGGLGINTPFGVIFSTNITPDAETGIGNLSSDEFFNALHGGIGPKRAPLYPAMPYPSFTLVSRSDSDAMLAYLKTVPAVRNSRPANRLAFPANFRFLMHAWNLLFFRRGATIENPTKSHDWNRGAYLVNGLGHCGSCHTPKNVFGSDKADKSLAGGVVETYVAPDLTANARIGLGKWSIGDIVEYLETGRNAHANASGPMADVITNSTSLLSRGDLRAMAVYLKDQPASPRERDIYQQNPAAMRRGKAIYEDACASCHMLNGGGQPRVFPPLANNAMLQQSNPAGLLHLILAGGRTAPTAARPAALSMPSFAWKLSDSQVADVVTYLRNSFGNQAMSVDAKAVAQMRKKLGLTKTLLTDSSGDR